MKVTSSFLRFMVLMCAPLLLASSGAQTASSSPVQTPIAIQGSLADASLNSKVEALLHKMTLEEKVGQLVQYSAGQPTGPGTGRDRKSVV